MREKRQYRRAVLSTLVNISQSEGSKWEVPSIDISRGGMFLSGASEVAIGTEIVLQFDFPEWGMLTVPGFVRWKSAIGFGVQFGLLGAKETRAIGAFVQRSSLSPE